MNGAITDTYCYDAYGMLLEQTGSTTNPYLYRGEQCDAETDAYYLRARYYQPGTGRFFSTDPVEGDTSDPTTFHRYLYGKNDPVNNVDPSGEFSLPDALQAVGMIGILSGISAGTWVAGDHIPGLYNWIAEYLAPDAGILGLSLVTKIRGNKPPTPLSGVPDFVLPYILWPHSTDLWWKERLNAGITAGAEVMWSFGSAQRGYFIYAGFQSETGYTNQPNKSRGDFEANLYTGYVFNLWNCDDYLGDFTGINFPSGSFFYDPTRIVDNWGPWGLSWTIGGIATRAKSSQSKMFGGNQTVFARTQAFPPTNVSYGRLAIEWTLLQASLTAYFAFKGQTTAAVATGFGTAFTGLIAKSKQIYNKRHDIDLSKRRDDDRPPLWKNGPSNPLSKLLGLFL